METDAVLQTRVYVNTNVILRQTTVACTGRTNVLICSTVYGYGTCLTVLPTLGFSLCLNDSGLTPQSCQWLLLRGLSVFL